jgi:hypothetical protein
VAECRFKSGLDEAQKKEETATPKRNSPTKPLFENYLKNALT